MLKTLQKTFWCPRWSQNENMMISSHLNDLQFHNGPHSLELMSVKTSISNHRNKRMVWHIFIDWERQCSKTFKSFMISFTRPKHGRLIKVKFLLHILLHIFLKCSCVLPNFYKVQRSLGPIDLNCGGFVAKSRKD